MGWSLLIICTSPGGKKSLLIVESGNFLKLFFFFQLLSFDLHSIAFLNLFTGERKKASKIAVSLILRDKFVVTNSFALIQEKIIIYFIGIFVVIIRKISWNLSFNCTSEIAVSSSLEALGIIFYSTLWTSYFGFGN